LPRGAYVWLYPSDKVSGSAQVNAWYSILKDDMGELPMVIDFEKTYWGGKPANPQASDLYGVTERWMELTSRRPIIYTGYYYWLDNGSTASYWKQFDLWIARYKADAPLVPPPFDKWTFWQWTETGDGIFYGHDYLMSRAADLNYFNGDAEEFKDYSGYEVPDPPEPPTGDDTMYKGTVITSALNIRAAPNTSGAKIGQLTRNDKVEASEIIGGWWKLTKITQEGINVKLPAATCYAYQGEGNGYIRLDETIPDPPVGDTVTVTVTTADGKSGTATIELV
jgi:hypothetical protein